MIPLLLDQGLPRRTASDLRDLGWDVVHVGEVGMSSAPDHAILDRARDEGRAVVTLDSDFSRILAERRAHQPSVIHVRIERLDRERATRLLERIVTTMAFDLEAGVIAAVRKRGTRMRRLPIF